MHYGRDLFLLVFESSLRTKFLSIKAIILKKIPKIFTVQRQTVKFSIRFSEWALLHREWYLRTQKALISTTARLKCEQNSEPRFGFVLRAYHCHAFACHPLHYRGPCFASSSAMFLLCRCYQQSSINGNDLPSIKLALDLVKETAFEIIRLLLLFTADSFFEGGYDMKYASGHFL